MRRGARRAEKNRQAAEKAAFDHSSRYGDLKSLVEEHMLDSDGPTATSGWRPSRRGNSPRSEVRRKT